jgi:glycosyltransferase involved in cell wall biosynthesis
MRLLHVVPTYLPATRYGGPIHSVHGLCRALSGLGHDVHVATTSVDGDRDSDVAHGRPVELDGVKVWYFRSKTLRRLYYSPPMQKAADALLAGVDVLHLHSVFLWPTSILARVAAHKCVPYVVSPRGMLVQELIKRQSRYVKTAWLTLIESETLRSAAAIHMTSRRELEDARKLPLPLPAPFVVPNGVELPAPGFGARAGERVRRLLAGPPYALYLGRIHWKKGLDRAVAALSGTGINLVVCGNDEDNYRPELERAVADQHLQNTVRFETEVAGDDKWALLSGARLVLMPSYNENFGNVVTEAMAVGRPVVATEEVGAAEILINAEAGLVCEGSGDALRAALLRLWDDPQLADRLGARGRSYVTAQLTWPRIAERMAERYASLISSVQNAAPQPGGGETGPCSSTSHR